MASLTALRLQYNGLTSLPEGLSQLQQLTSLDVRELQTLPGSLALVPLAWLDLTDAGLRVLRLPSGPFHGALFLSHCEGLQADIR